MQARTRGADRRTARGWLVVRSLAFSVIAGVALSVVIALGCALWSGVRHDWVHTFGDYYPHLRPKDWPPLSVATVQRGRGITQTHAQAGQIPDSGSEEVFVRHVATGLPLRCLAWVEGEDARYSMRFGAPPQVKKPVSFGWRSGIAVPAWLHPLPDRRIPLMPVWTGLLVNPLLFATGLFSTWMLAAGARRAWYARTGRCRWCGYELSQDVCPECGARDRQP